MSDKINIPQKTDNVQYKSTVNTKQFSSTFKYLGTILYLALSVRYKTRSISVGRSTRKHREDLNIGMILMPFLLSSFRIIWEFCPLRWYIT